MAQDDYYEKVQELRREQPHVSSNPKTAKTKPPSATFQIRSVNPNKGFALIDTDRKYGVAGADLSTRKIQVGDELPEGSVTGITREGIMVIPPSDDELAPVSDEFVIPFGKRTGFIPKVNPKPTYDGVALKRNPRMASFLDTLTSQSGFREDGIEGSDAAVTTPALGPGQTNTEIYAKHLPEHLQDDPDALAAAAEDAAAKNYDQLLEEYGDDAISGFSDTEIDGESWTKIVMKGGETFYTSPDGKDVLRDHDTLMPGVRDPFAEMGSFPAYESIEPLEYMERSRLGEKLEETMREYNNRYADEDE